MQLETLEKKQNKLMEREELVLELKHQKDKTPKRAELLKHLAANLGVPEDSLIIDKIETAFGRPETKISLYVYKDADSIPQNQAEWMKKRMNRKKKGEAAK